ncbi:MAG: peptide chain release factor N(5)-glutamine methyltransferase [Planctomycetota bacterium]
MNAPTKTSWTTRELLKWMADAFESRGLESPRVLAELLMGHVLGCERIRLYMEADRPASSAERETLRGLVGRALKHEPVQYLVGEAVFFTHTFTVDPRVLVPRPSSAVLVETVIEHAKSTGRHAVNPYDDEAGEAPGEDDDARAAHVAAPMTIADVCTGSGALAIALARAIPSSTVVATDVSADALDVARANAERLGVSDRVAFEEGDLLVPLAGRRFDAVVANPPYIPDDEWGAVEANVKEHEPTLALRSSPDGLRHAEPILRGVGSVLAEGGVFAVEVATSKAHAALGIARDAGYADAHIVRDFEGLDRAIVGGNR